MKIVVLDGYGANPGDLSWEPFRQLGELVVYPRTAPNELIGRAKDAEIVLTNKVVLDAQVLQELKLLKYVGVLATGYNVVDIQAAKRLGIVVTNIPSYSTDSVAQMTFAHILNIMNRVDHYAIENRNGRWSRNQDFCYWDTPLRELAGKTIGIVGLGHIGKKVACIARDFQKTTMDGLFAISAILTLHCPLTPTTRDLINKETLAKMKEGAILINTGRGPLVNEQDVADALASGHLGAYGADVMCQEPPTENHPLFKQPNAFITPHIAWATVEARERLMEIAVHNVKAFLEGNPVHVVNP